MRASPCLKLWQMSSSSDSTSSLQRFHQCTLSQAMWQQLARVSRSIPLYEFWRSAVIFFLISPRFVVRPSFHLLLPCINAALRYLIRDTYLMLVNECDEFRVPKRCTNTSFRSENPMRFSISLKIDHSDRCAQPFFKRHEDEVDELVRSAKQHARDAKDQVGFAGSLGEIRIRNQCRLRLRCLRSMVTGEICGQGACGQWKRAN